MFAGTMSETYQKVSDVADDSPVCDCAPTVALRPLSRIWKYSNVTPSDVASGNVPRKW